MKEINLAALIISLQKLQDKGIATVQIEGTLMSKDDGNRILASTKPQM